MSLSFRTNGNFIDFVNTDATSLQVETVLMKLHNTSRCIDWSLPEDTTKISFTIDEIKYSNIPISEIDFDGTVMNSQDDFETGITGMFEGLAGGGSGGGEGMVLEEYDNSATSAPVMAYVFRDADDNIYRVYEPIRDNDVSTSFYAPGEPNCLDKFQFDNNGWYSNRIISCSLNNIGNDAVFHENKMTGLIIDGYNKTGLVVYNNRQSHQIEGSSPFWNLNGDNIEISDNPLIADNVTLTMGDNCILDKTIISSAATITISGGGDISECFIGVSSELTISGAFDGNFVGNDCSINDGGFDVVFVTFGHAITKTVTEDLEEQVFQRIDGVTYQLGSIINQPQGTDGSFTDPDGNTITVVKGLITAITPP